ncbi:MAG: hypothetical protein DRQ51_02635 [Gammaproteobacteria bacterium]|nr:MAG: hypothetical protein DRQ51_02635 [Gammaproteobacteria bacterium]
MTLKQNEVFVADSLEKYFKNKGSDVSYVEGKNPPDIVLSIDNKNISVEISTLNQNSTTDIDTINFGYFAFRKVLDEKIGDFLQKNDLYLYLTFYHNSIGIKNIKKIFIKNLMNYIENKKLVAGKKIEDVIGGVGYSIEAVKTIPRNKSNICLSVMPFGGKFFKMKTIEEVLKNISFCNVDIQLFNIVNERLSTKKHKCKELKKPIWLALQDGYLFMYSNFKDKNHIEDYKQILDKSTIPNIFEKILIVFNNGDVLEYN